MKILAFETSCDETAAAVVADGRHVLSSVVRTQIDLHRLYGGVVPEIASRAHVESISQLAGEALAQAGCGLADLGAVGVTAWPGLIGALLVGVNFAKSLALSAGLPLVPVHHLRGHIAACRLADPALAHPFLCLVVSGGHTSLVWAQDPVTFRTVGRTRDDAAGECLDKVARLLGLPYPGGVALDRLAQRGDPAAFRFPDAEVRDAPLDFSFSGLKTAAINQLHQLEQRGQAVDPADFAASFVEAVAQALCRRLELAAAETGAPVLALCGGVAANTALRRHAQALADRLGLPLTVPPPALCGDNAAMIGAQAHAELLAGHTAGSDLNALATRSLDQG
ncbi:MAG: tRNA (adenosine(37)-N6)-threonylcarbamoyltransferase complex transferase subunit TsaD [Clostridiales bacterium]|nr:tRNA (adenosine(37)-N6)-threonylcarbamoyltransferase complex transferase subunit TsaD [Clostridiales bacterium]